MRSWRAVLLAGCLCITCTAASGQTESNAGGRTDIQGKPQKPQAGEKGGATNVAPARESRFDYQVETTTILQSLARFHSPYEGPSSFRSRSEAEITQTCTLFAGARLRKNLEVYVNPELALGHGIGGETGLAGYTNADLIGQQALRPEPYLARYFVRWRVPMPHLGPHAGGEEEAEEQTGRALNVLSGTIPTHRLVVTVGKFGVSDIFDVNSYANNPRTQFLNNAFGNNLAFDYPQETRGYDLGLALAWTNPNWALRFGTFALPTAPGGPDLAYSPGHSHGEVLEAEVHPQAFRRPKPPIVVRLTLFRNTAPMARYSDALAGAASGSSPDLSGLRRAGTSRSGIGLNAEQALADGGNTGVFARIGWADGDVESWNFAECDRFFSAGAQIAGSRWSRGDDRVGVAWAVSDISAAHRAYLAGGGTGLGVGDGGLRAGDERVFEAYYSFQLSKPLALSVNVQSIKNPGYNRDRGPLSVWLLRLHGQF